MMGKKGHGTHPKKRTVAFLVCGQSSQTFISLYLGTKAFMTHHAAK